MARSLSPNLDSIIKDFVDFYIEKAPILVGSVGYVLEGATR
ncbi:MAG TPA: hypothetical protein VER14_03885 [Phototrophicaceae bacterium]|nr:hypothetical protein [Phototrophicaceae bacterium]